MIYLDINSPSEQAFLPDAINKGVDFIRKVAGQPDFVAGKYEIEGDNIFANLMEYQTQNQDQKMAEVHLDYIDIQAVISGREVICFSDPESDSCILPEYSEDNDCALLGQTSNDQQIILQPGKCVLLFPSEPHMPGCSTEPDTSEPVRKVVVKIHKQCLR